jgi:hypothetical protein
MPAKRERARKLPSTKLRATALRRMLPLRAARRARAARAQHVVQLVSARVPDRRTLQLVAVQLLARRVVRLVAARVPEAEAQPNLALLKARNVAR